MLYHLTKTRYAVGLLAIIGGTPCKSQLFPPISREISRQPYVGGTTGDVSRLVKFFPAEACVKRRTVRVDVDLHFVPAHGQGSEYYAFLIVNGTPSPPFIMAMTEGDIEVDERATWPIRFNHRVNEIQLRVIGLKTASGEGIRIADVSKFYRVRGVSC